MLSVNRKKSVFFATVFAVLGFSASANAACSPGIPCTDYDIYSNTNAGTDAALNGPKTGIASPFTETACDGNFMNQIYSRAFLEASREVIMSEQIIHKPDSVLEYTCFDKRLEVVAEHAGEIFTENQSWHEKEICMSTGDDTTNDPSSCPDGSGENVSSPSSITINDGGSTSFDDQVDHSVFEKDRLDNTLERFLFDTLQDYVDTNFGHTFLGEASTLDNDIDTSNLNSDISGVDNAPTASNFDCTHMQAVWHVAQCIDFSEDDRFRTFTHLMEFDPRTIPQACTPASMSSDAVEAGTNSTKVDSTSSGTESDMESECPTAAPGTTANTGITFDHLRVANNCDDGSDLNEYSSFDVMELYHHLILGVGAYLPGTGNTLGQIGVGPSVPGDAMPATSSAIKSLCADPLPTGLYVITSEYSIASGAFTNDSTIADPSTSMSLHFDQVCPTPGCYYQTVTQPFSLGGGITFPPITTPGTCIPY